MDIRKPAAELVGMFLFMTLGYFSVAAFGAAEVPGLIVVPFSFGLGLLAAIFAVGHISGGHFNPAVTVAMILDRRTEPVEGIAYIVAQVIGALGAAALVAALLGQSAVAAGETIPGGGMSDTGALILEAVLTAGFLSVILASTKRAPSLAPVAIPLTLVAIHFASASLTGSSVNPARSIGSALVGGGDGVNVLWVYIVGPIVGGIVGWAVWRFLDGGREPAAA